MSVTDFDTSLLVLVLEWIFILYFLILHGGHLLLTTVSMKGLGLRMESVAVRMLPRLSAGYEVPLSIIVPVTEDVKELGNFVQALFNLDYPEFEVVVVDDTPDGINLAQLQSAFDLVVFPEAYWRQVRAKPVRSMYRSARYPALRVVDKTSGGLGDAINAGINAARYPIFCIVRPDCIVRRDSLRRLAQIFSDDSTTVAAGAGERFTNGRFVVHGFLERCRLPARPLSWPMISAALRKDLCARFGWDSYNGALSFSDRFCAFRKDTVVQIGGCRRKTVNPVWDLLLRVHRSCLGSGRPYRTSFLPAPVVWRTLPASARQLIASAANEHLGLSEAMRDNRELSRIQDGGVVGRLAFPFVALTEVAGPLIEVLAFVFFLAAFAVEIVPATHLAAFLISSIGLGILLSWLAVLLDALTFQTYRNAGAYLVLLIAAVFENAGFRQVLALCTVTKSLLRARSQAEESQPEPGSP